ncbi:homing endonuclease associated repeat-containing protein [Halorutilales archaeon Cl-col2-1]
MTSGKQTDKQDLIDELKRLADMTDDEPKVKHVRKYGEYSYTAYRRYFDSWEEALDAAGITEKSSEIKIEIKIELDKTFSFSI